VSVALIIKDGKPDTPMVPVATEATFSTVWQSGAKALSLEWIAAMQFGIVVTAENRAAILEELGKLRVWFEENGYSVLHVRIDMMVTALNGLQFDKGETAWIG